MSNCPWATVCIAIEARRRAESTHLNPTHQHVHAHTCTHSLPPFVIFLTSATSFWKVRVSCERPKEKGPSLLGIMDSHWSSKGMETLKGRLPMMWKLGGSGVGGGGVGGGWEMGITCLEELVKTNLPSCHSFFNTRGAHFSAMSNFKASAWWTSRRPPLASLSSYMQVPCHSITNKLAR